MKKIGFAVSLAILLSAGFWAPAFAGGKVLVVQSYHKGYVWTDSLQGGIDEALSKSGAEVEVVYLDAKRHPAPAAVRKAAQAARARLDAFKPDVILAADDQAQEYFAGEVASSGLAKVVYCGVNGDAGKYGYPSKNAVGIVEKAYVAELGALLSSLRDNIRTVVVLSDKNPSSSLTIKSITSENNLPFKIAAVVQVPSLAEWKKAVVYWRGRADAVIVANYAALQDGKDMADMSSVMEWTAANAQMPVAALHDFAVRDGSLCSVSVSAREHGLAAGILASDLLSGKPMTLLSPVEEKPLSMVNLAAAEHFGVRNVAALASADSIYAVKADGALMLAVAKAKAEALLDRMTAAAETAAGRLSGGVRGPQVRAALRELCASVPFSIDCTAVDGSGVMVTIEPPAYAAHEGSKIAGQEHMVRMYASKAPVMSDTFRSVEGDNAVDLAYPFLNKDGKVEASASLLLKPEGLFKAVDEAFITDRDVKFWAAQVNGRIIYDRDAPQIGLMLFSDLVYTQVPSLQAFAKKMVAGEKGTGTYEFFPAMDDHDNTVGKLALWDTVGRFGTQWRLILSGLDGKPAR